VHVHAMARQIDGCGRKVEEIIQGTKGVWKSKDMSIYDLDGNLVWQYDDNASKAKFKTQSDYVLEHINLVNHIRSEKVIDIAETTAVSSMACIMARESAYTGKEYTWEQMVTSDLDLMPKELHLGNVDMKQYESIPLPGLPAQEKQS